MNKYGFECGRLSIYGFFFLSMVSTELITPGNDYEKTTKTNWLRWIERRVEYEKLPWLDKKVAQA